MLSFQRAVGRASTGLRSCTVGLFVKCILQFSDMHIQTIKVMPNSVCHKLHFNFKIFMFCEVVNIQVVMLMFKLFQLNFV